MILYTNQNGEIKDVNVTSDQSLIPLTIDDETSPFKDWSVAKICCYKVTVFDGQITMMTPYVDSRLIEHIDKLGNGHELNESDITDTRGAIMELYEMIIGG